MPEILFYKTLPLEVEKTFYSLVEKSNEKGLISVAIFNNEEKLDLINDFLWTNKQDSFLPHVKRSDEIVTDFSIPLYLTTEEENPYNAEILFSIDGYIPKKIDSWERLIFIADPNDNALLEKYKKFYETIKRDFKKINFYKKTENGKWAEDNFMG
mgnify:FL=1